MLSLVQIGPVVLEKKVFKICQCIYVSRNFVIISPWKGRGPSFEQTWIPFTQGCFVPSLVEIGPAVLEKKFKMWKVYRRTDRQQVIRKAHMSFQLRWAKKGGGHLFYIFNGGGYYMNTSCTCSWTFSNNINISRSDKKKRVNII